MEFVINNHVIEIPEKVISDWNTTMNMEITTDDIAVHLESAKGRHPDFTEDKLSQYTIDEIYRNLSRYDTFPG